MPETKDKPPASQDKIPVSEQQRPPTASEQQAALNVQAFNIEASRRTGKSVEEATALVERLQTKGDFFDEKGRWTLDIAGYPVCHYGWKPEPIESLAP